MRTILTRLVEKGAVGEAKQGNRSLYEPLVSRDDARQTAVRSLLDKAFDGAFGSLFHYLAKDDDLSAEDRARIERLLREGGDES